MTESQIEKMIAAAAAKLGMSADALKSKAMSGDVDGILSHMDSSSAEKVRSAIKDKKLTDELSKKFNK